LRIRPEIAITSYHKNKNVTIFSETPCTLIQQQSTNQQWQNTHQHSGFKTQKRETID